MHDHAIVHQQLECTMQLERLEQSMSGTWFTGQGLNCLEMSLMNIVIVFKLRRTKFCMVTILGFNRKFWPT